MSQVQYQPNKQTLINQGGLDMIKAKMKATWEDGNYADFARYMEPGAIEILHEWDIPLECNLLDVGCGAGQLVIPAARQGYQVTGVDIATNLIIHAKQRALKEGLAAKFDVGDAENLPYENSSFDIAMSMFGAMFAPSAEKVVNEFARVLRPGGKLYMANWTTTSMPAQMFACVSKIMPPPNATIDKPVLWGSEEIVIQRLDENFTDIKLTRKIYPKWSFPFSTTALVDFFKSYFGPVKRAFDFIEDKTQQQALRAALETIYETNSICHDQGITIIGGEYLEVIATRKPG